MSEPSGTQYGGFWIRLIALLADSAIVFLIAALGIAGAAATLGPELMPLVAVAVSAFGLLYWPLMHASSRQATFGKSLLGLKVARLHGGRISILRSFGREISKVFSSMVFMLGYLMAAFTPRKQALHDLVASTYVVREGVSRLVPALAIVVAGFGLPVVVVPLIAGAAAMSMMTNMATGMVSQPDPMKQATPKPKATVQVAKVAPKPQPPTAPAPIPAAPTPTVQAPMTQTAAIPAPPVAPPPIAMADAPKPTAEAPKPKAEAPKPKAEAPKAEAPKAAPVRLARPAPSVPAAFEPKVASGPKFNDLMTAVLYRDADGVVELLRFGKWPDKPDSRGVTPLMTAVELGDARSAEALLRAGANPYHAFPVAEGRGDGDMILLLKRYSGR